MDSEKVIWLTLAIGFGTVVAVATLAAIEIMAWSIFLLGGYVFG